MTAQEEREEQDEDDNEREMEDDEDTRDVETGEEVEVEGSRFLSANSLAALEMIGEFQQRRLRGAASGSNSAAAAEEALEAGEEAAAAAVEHRVEAAADARVGNGEARREGINIIGAGNVPFGAEEGFRSDRGGFLIIGHNTGPRGRGRVLYFGTPGAHRAQQQRIPKDAKIHRNVKR